MKSEKEIRERLAFVEKGKEQSTLRLNQALADRYEAARLTLLWVLE